MRITQDPNGAAIDAANRSFVESFVRKDSAAVASLYTVDGRLLPPRSDFVIGRTAIAQYWQEAMKIGTRELETTELEICGSMAHEVGRYRVVAPDAGETASGLYIVIWKREEGIWRMHRDIWNIR